MDPLDQGAVNRALRLLVNSVQIDWQSGQLALDWRHSEVTAVPFVWPGSPGGDVSDIPPT